MIRQLIREMLLTERVYGAQAVVYHGSKAPPDVFVPALLDDMFTPGEGDGDMYGKALYCVYDLEGTKTEAGDYGKYIYKFKVNLYGFICFDPDVAQLVYKRPLTPVEQAQELGLDETLIEQLKGIRIESGFTSDTALPASKFLKGKVKGLIFTGSTDGRVAAVYDQTIAVPFAWKRVSDKSWTAIDKSSLKPALKKSALGDWEAEKYDFDPVALLAKLSKLPVDKRVVKGKLDLSNNAMIASLPAGLKVGGSLDLSGTGITSLPAGLQVGGDLNLSYTKITSLPDGLKVGGDLEIYGCRNITSLPVDLQVGGSLYLKGTSITSLPAGLKVGLNLDLSYNTNITSLPAGLQVGGELYLNNTMITSLPADLQVGGDLNLNNTGIRLLPAGLQVGYDIYGFRGKKSQVPQHLKGKVR